MQHWKLRSFCSRFMAHEFKPAEFHATCCGDKILSPQQNFFAKTGMSHEEYCRCNMSPRHGPVTCPLVCAGLYTLVRTRVKYFSLISIELIQGKLTTVETFWALTLGQSNSLNVVSVPNFFLCGFFLFFSLFFFFFFFFFFLKVFFYK